MHFEWRMVAFRFNAPQNIAMNIIYLGVQICEGLDKWDSD